MKRFLINYRHDGERYALELHANSELDAQERLRSLFYGQVCGELAFKLPVYAGPVAALICWLRNGFAR